MSPLRFAAAGLAALLLSAACGPSSSPPAPRAVTPTCNGAAALCDRRYDAVVNLTTHNAMSNAEEGFWFAPNQDFAIPRQLADGVRGLSIDVHPNPEAGGAILTCHGTCAVGSRLLSLTFDGVRDFLDATPDAVVTILYESAGVPDADVARVLRDTGLAAYAYAQATDAVWPTLGAMIAAGRRLVVFSQDGDGVDGLILPMWRYTWDTPYEATDVDDFSCDVGRGDARNSIMQINHFLTAPLAGQHWAAQANTYAVLWDHVMACRERWGKLPTFLWVDWYATGDAMQVVRDLNDQPR